LKIGIYGGSFNPIHNGHIGAAETVQQKFNLDRLLFIPTNQTPLKNPEDLEVPDHRKAMVELAIQEIPNSFCSSMELERGGTSYSIDTATQIKRELQEDDELYWIVGIDSFSSIREWKDYTKIFAMAHFIVLTGTGFDFPLGVLPGTLISKYQRGDDENDFVSKQGNHIYFVETSKDEIHATEIRSRLKTKGNVSKLLPPKVVEYIMEHKLFGARD